jgi:hypothetical protein
MDIGGSSVDVTEMVTGSGPQLNVMIPPPLTALDSAVNVQLDAAPVPTTVLGWLVSTGCASAGNVNVVQEPVGFPAIGSAAEGPAPLEVPLEAPDSLEALPELAPPLVPDPNPPAPLLGLLSEPVSSDEAPAFWPEVPFASEPMRLLQPTPSAAQMENESRIRSVHIAVLASKVLP